MAATDHQVIGVGEDTSVEATLVAAPSGSSCPTPCELNVFATGGTLTAGSSYFVVIVADSFTWDSWNWNSNGYVGLLDQNTGSGWNQFPGSTLGGMAIDTTAATPEPGTILMLGSGLLGALGVMRRKVANAIATNRRTS